jgi:hypothetical protein
MSGNPLFYSTFAVTGSPAAAAETVVATLSGVDLRYSDQVIKLSGSINFTVGTSGNAATLRLRRDSLTGTQVGTSQTLPVTEVVATDTVIGAIYASDQPGNVAGATYVMTLQVATAAATSTVNNVNITARVD